MTKRILKCPECDEYLDEETQKAIQTAFAVVMMSPAGRYLEFSGEKFLCVDCFEKNEIKKRSGGDMGGG